jgi:hypothetical protein
MSRPAPIWLAPAEPRCLDNAGCIRHTRCARALVDGPTGRPVVVGSVLLATYGLVCCGMFLDAASHRKAPSVERKVHDFNRGLA